MAINPYSLFPTKTDAPDASYPYGSARNVTAPGDGTGTPWREEILNDIWGYLQALLTVAGITPSGNPDTATVSQYFDAMRATSGYPGVLVPLAQNASNPPATLGLRILICDGSYVSRVTYPELDAVCYCGDGANGTASSFYHTNHAFIRVTSGELLRLPDLRGQFLRGLDTAEVRDEDGSGRIIGSYETPAVSAHEHDLEAVGGVSLPLYYSNVDAGAGATSSMVGSINNQPAYNPQATSIISGAASVLDNRPYNMAVNWGVWY